MSGTLAGRVARLTGLTVAGALVVAGLVTALLVWQEQRAALDRELLAAVESFGGSAGQWQVEHPDGRIRVWEARLDELPRARTDEARDRERPVAFDQDGQRIMLLITERPEPGEREGEERDGERDREERAGEPDREADEPGDAHPDEPGDEAHPRDDERSGWEALSRWDARRAAREGREVHRLVAASAPSVDPWSAMTPFLLAYAGASVVVAGLATISLGRVARLALAPLDEARRAADAAAGAAHGVRLAEDGPEEVRGLLTAMNALLARMDAAAAAQSRFTAEAAHELRTPLTVLLGELELALRRPRDAASLTETLRSAREEGLRLAALVEGLLTLARIDAGQAEQGRELVRLGELVAVAVDRERPTVEAAGGSLTVELREDPELEGHKALLVAAIANLLRNAAVHAPGTAVRLVADRGSGRARVVVADEGPGIPVADRDAVFDRLARGGGARRRTTGLGLGLPLAREIARRHGGECRIVDGDRGCRVEWWV